jgi:hypothetical protein
MERLSNRGIVQFETRLGLVFCCPIAQLPNYKMV